MKTSKESRTEVNSKVWGGEGEQEKISALRTQLWFSVLVHLRLLSAASSLSIASSSSLSLLALSCMATLDRLALLSRRAQLIDESSTTWLPDDLQARHEGADPTIGARREVIIDLMLQVLAAERRARSPPSPAEILGLTTKVIPYPSSSIPSSACMGCDPGLDRWLQRLILLRSISRSVPPVLEPENPVSLLPPPDTLCTQVRLTSSHSLEFQTIHKGFVARIIISASQTGPHTYSCHSEPDLPLHRPVSTYIEQDNPLSVEHFIHEVIWPALHKLVHPSAS
jgi:hypothetical protein